VDGLFKDISTTDFHDDIHRNIVSLRESENLFDDLIDSSEGRKSAIDLEAETKPHTYVSHQPIIDRPFEEAAYNEAIDYPFEHWIETRYSNGSFGVWYGTDTLETGIHETIHHWRNGLLEDAGWKNVEGIIGERKIYNVRCDAVLLNFIPKLDTFPSLVDPNNYDYTHRVGARIHHEGHPGLTSHSARCEGDIFAIFNPQILSNPRQVCYLTYRIESGSVMVERQPGETLFQIK